jgi:hypothetical protein
MKAKLLLKQKIILHEKAFVELVIWKLPAASTGSLHLFIYRLAYVVEGVCVLRYDNETGKGDPRHIGKKETPYRFSTPEKLLEDFWNDVEKFK